MINAKELTTFLTNLGLNYFTGVPDSLMSKLCWELVKQSEQVNSKIETKIVANWKPKSPPVEFREVLLDGSTKLEKLADYIFAINVIEHVPDFLSLIANGIKAKTNDGVFRLVCPNYTIPYEPHFNIPIIFLIGWRGDPNTKDEPQHVFQGQITLKTLDILAVPTLELNSTDGIDYLIDSNIVQRSVANRKSCVILFASGAI